MNRIHEVCPSVEIVQLNTDGWVLCLPNSELSVLNATVEAWSSLTGFTVETDIIKQMWQRDVNNYVIEFDTGKVKAKGGAVKNWAGGTFQSNSCTIVDEALVKYMIYGVPLRDTINSCTDLDRLQVVLRAGSTYTECCKALPGTTAYMRLHGRVHRVYPVKQGGYTFYKRKGDEGNPARFPDAPEKAKEDFEILGIDEVDYDWYNVLAQKRLDAFLKGDENE